MLLLIKLHSTPYFSAQLLSGIRLESNPIYFDSFIMLFRCLIFQLGDVLSVVFGELSKLPRYLIPCYFEAVNSVVYNYLVQSAVTKMGK